MSAYEEFMIIINAAMLIVAILVYIARKNGTKKIVTLHPKVSDYFLIEINLLEATLWSGLPFCTFIINLFHLLSQLEFN